MKLHANARTCLHSRSLLVRRVLEEGRTRAQAVEAAGVSVRTVSRRRGSPAEPAEPELVETVRGFGYRYRKTS